MKNTSVMSRRNHWILLAALLLITVRGSAQTPDENAAKYGLLRDRLRNEFMLCTGDASVAGSHLPMENRYVSDGKKVAYWADGVWWLGHYVAVLATEYRSLQLSGLSTDETLKELRLALSVYDRLDLAAERCWGGTDSLNGFYLRDDVGKDFAPRYGADVIVCDYERNCGKEGTRGNAPSQDQAWGSYLGFALAQKLVDDDSVRQQVAKIASRMVRAMQFTDGKGRRHWQIMNPVTGALIQKEGDIQWLQYAHGEIGSMLSGENLHFGRSRSATWRGIWNILQDNVLIDSDGHFTWYGVMLLSAVMDEGGTSSRNCYEWLVKVCNKIVKRNPDMQQTLFFPHLPLANLVLYGKEGKKLLDKSVYEPYLNSAPADGAITKNIDGQIVRTPAPWHTLSLFCPWHDKTAGDGNMIDYMLLYNLYRLVYEQ